MREGRSASITSTCRLARSGYSKRSRRADAKRQGAGPAPVELEQRAVLADEDVGARGQRRGLRGGRDAVLAEIVGEHALELGVAGGVDVDLGAAQVHGVAKAPDARVVEHQPVEPDVRVEDKSEHGAQGYAINGV